MSRFLALLLVPLILAGCRSVPDKLQISMYEAGGLSQIISRDFVIVREGDEAHWRIEVEPLHGDLSIHEGRRDLEALKALYNILMDNDIKTIQDAGLILVTDQRTFTVTLNDGQQNYGFKVYAPAFQPDQRYKTIVDAIVLFCKETEEP